MKLRIIGLVAAIALPISALAAPIVGTIDIAGDVEPTIGGVVTTNLAAADGLHFPGFGTTVDAAGDFAPIPDGTTVIRNDIVDFSPLALTNPLWEIMHAGITYSFDLLTISVDFQNGTFLNLSGTGTVSATGFDDTDGVWALSVQRAGMEFSFSSTTDTRPPVIPEPSIPALFGIGLLVAGLARARR